MAEFSAPPDSVVSGTSLTKSSIIDFVRRNLGEGVWDVEITEKQLDAAIETALRKYSRRLPHYRYGHLTMNVEQTRYKFPDEIDLGFGICHIEFVEPIFFGSHAFINKRLLGVTSIGSYRIDEYDIFVRWRQSFQRITSTKPSWMWEEDTKVLWLYNPIPNIRVTYTAMCPVRGLKYVRQNDEDWVYDYVLAHCKLILGENRGKFSGVIPGPSSKDLQLNANTLREDAKSTLDKLEAHLRSIQRRIPPSFH